MYKDYKIYGPYKSSKDNRLRLVIRKNNINKTLSYPKYLMECYLGRYLKNDETVDHIDGNVLNNNINNLQILNRSTHAKQDVIRVKDQEFVCPICKNKFKRRVKGLDRDKAGPFCSRRCVGKYGMLVQNSKIDVLPPKGEINKKYYKNKAAVVEQSTRET